MQTSSSSHPVPLKQGTSGYPRSCLSWSGERRCQIDAPNDRDAVVVADENKDIQVLFLGAGTVKLHVQCEHVTYAHSSSKMDPSSFVT